MAYLDLTNIAVSYDGKTNVLQNLNFSVEKGELVSLLGPSGCGKSTTLRTIAGLIDPVEGTFLLSGIDMTHVPVHKRDFGLVFQSYALFPHLTVQDNIGFGLKLRKISAEEQKKRIKDITDVVDLAGLETRYPAQLSGGQRQRVALARALVIQPKLLLLDEPLSNLDAKLRLAMRVEIKRIQRELGITTIFVTHDQVECFSISDKVAIMNNGIIEQYDTPEAIYENPATEFIARFTGFENFIDIKLQDNHAFADNLELTYMTDLPEKVRLAVIRPEYLKITESSDSVNTLKANIKVRTFLGDGYQYDLQTTLGNLVATESSEEPREPGETIYLYIDPARLRFVS